jgi:hypothetical protein
MFMAPARPVNPVRPARSRRCCPAPENASVAVACRCQGHFRLLNWTLLQKQLWSRKTFLKSATPMVRMAIIGLRIWDTPCFISSTVNPGSRRPRLSTSMNTCLGSGWLAFSNKLFTGLQRYEKQLVYWMLPPPYSLPSDFLRFSGPRRKEMTTPTKATTTPPNMAV